MELSVREARLEALFIKLRDVITLEIKECSALGDKTPDILAHVLTVVSALAGHGIGTCALARVVSTGEPDCTEAVEDYAESLIEAAVERAFEFCNTERESAEGMRRAGAAH